PSRRTLVASLSTPPTTPTTSPLSLHDALPILHLLDRKPTEQDLARPNRRPPWMPLEQLDHLPRDRVLLTDQLDVGIRDRARALQDRKSTRLNSSHQIISYAVFCLKKKKKNTQY